MNGRSNMKNLLLTKNELLKIRDYLRDTLTICSDNDHLPTKFKADYLLRENLLLTLSYFSTSEYAKANCELDDCDRCKSKLRVSVKSSLDYRDLFFTDLELAEDPEINAIHDSKVYVFEIECKHCGSPRFMRRATKADYDRAPTTLKSYDFTVFTDYEVHSRYLRARSRGSLRVIKSFSSCLDCRECF